MSRKTAARISLAVAFTLAAAMTLIHVFIGGRLIAAPLLASELADLPRLTLYLCWHGITLVLAGMALLALDAGFWRRRADSAWLLTGLAAGFAALGGFLILYFGVSPLQLPQWIAFAPMAVAAAVGARLLG